jgi:hypothetical protein
MHARGQISQWDVVVVWDDQQLAAVPGALGIGFSAATAAAWPAHVPAGCRGTCDPDPFVFSDYYGTCVLLTAVASIGTGFGTGFSLSGNALLHL